LLWEGLHFFTGRISLIMGLVTISLGLIMAVPHQVLWIIWFSYVGFIVVVYIFLELYRKLSDRHKRVTKQITKDEFYANLLNEVNTRTNSGRTSVTGRTMSIVEPPRRGSVMKGMVNGGYDAPKGESTLELTQQEINQFGENVKPRILSNVDEDDENSSKNSDPLYDNVESMNDIIEVELERAEKKEAEEKPPPVPEKKFGTDVDLSVTGNFEDKENEVDIDGIFKTVSGPDVSNGSTSRYSVDDVLFTHL
jgi:hypothetical protein